MKDTPIQILDHIYYKDEASLQTNRFKIAPNGSKHMLDKNFSVCFLSTDSRKLFIASNEKTYDIQEINQKNMTNRVIYLSNQKKVSILSCEEYEDRSIEKILFKIIDLHEKLKNTKLNSSAPNYEDIKSIVNSWYWLKYYFLTLNGLWILEPEEVSYYGTTS